MYVALTRAKRSVTISYAQTRFRWGSHVTYPPSRFLKEIDKQFLNWPDSDSKVLTGGFGGESLQPKQWVWREKRQSTPPPKPPDPDFQADPVSKLKQGQKVEHDRFGFGQILSIEGDPLNLKAIVDFEQGGRKVLLLKFAKLRVVD